MLGKLVKHEMKATSRILSPLFLILFVLSILDRIVLNLGIFEGALAVIPVFVTVAYVIAIVAVIMVTFMIMIIRFYKNLLSDEGYLMFTLPVKSSELINSKLIVASFWTLLSVIAVLISLIIVFAKQGFAGDVQELISLIKAELDMALGGGSALLIIELIVMTLLSLINNILMIYVSIAIGQLFNGRKVIGSFGAYIAISMVIQLVVTIILLLAGLTFGESFTELNAIPQLVFPISILYLLILNGIFYFVTDFIFKKKLNLD